MNQTNQQISNPRLLAFEVTHRCRYKCLHCRAGDDGNNTEQLSTAQCKKILKSVADFNKCVIIFTGGEPMERPDIYELADYGREIGLRMVMATCGYLIDDKAIAKLKNAGILTLSFSLDGATAKTHDTFRRSSGAFDAAIAAARQAQQYNIRFQINTTITKSNLNEVAQIAKLSQKIGAYCFNPFILVPVGRGKQITDQILDSGEYEKLLNDLLVLKRTSPVEVRLTCGPQFARVYRQQGAQKIINHQLSIINYPKGCLGGREFGFISYRGDIQTCGFLPISAGNLVENNFDFAKIWRESKLLNDIRDLTQYKGNCGRCEYLDVCGGCRARAYAVEGDYLGSDPICSFNPKSKK